jgi:endonuclease III
MELAPILRTLSRTYGKPTRREPGGAFEMILFEVASYLVADDVRAAVYERLANDIGTTPQEILAASREDIARAIAAGGMNVNQRVAKVRRAAELAIDGIDLKDPVRARRALAKMPSIGEPGAEKIALFAGGHRALPLDSNGLRVLIRLGFGAEKKDYRAMYRSAQDAVTTPATVRACIDAHLLLRTHGKSVCKTKPRCDECALAPMCPSSTTLTRAEGPSSEPSARDRRSVERAPERARRSSPKGRAPRSSLPDRARAR